VRRCSMSWEPARLAGDALNRGVARRSDDAVSCSAIRSSERIVPTNGSLSHSVLGRDGAVYDPALVALDWEAEEHAQAVKAQSAIGIAGHWFCRLMPSGRVR
jgi:hypothetical protein